ncbi:hypothetical protein EGW08_001080 [Elysia chlorotica]|uniref:Uncharacterized protein n=1 Tax=Elysia chlorotica TaxID=188477 RepID=A0A3S1BTF4_ELYCH|nr:hypothetical protein EGW08_001080 [Elysia chlorotica]
MPAINCTAHHLVLHVPRDLALTRLLALLNVTLTPQHDPDLSPLEGGALGSRDHRTDSQGAMKFTVAVVLLYGVGVILMLGFHIRKSKWTETTEDDATRVVQKFDRNKSRMDRKYHKTRIENLVRSIHSVPLADVLASIDERSTLPDTDVLASIDERSTLPDTDVLASIDERSTLPDTDVLASIDERSTLPDTDVLASIDERSTLPDTDVLASVDERSTLPDTDVLVPIDGRSTLPDTDVLVSIDERSTLPDTDVLASVDERSTLPDTDVLVSIDERSTLPDSDVLVTIDERSTLLDANVLLPIDERSTLPDTYVLLPIDERSTLPDTDAMLHRSNGERSTLLDREPSSLVHNNYAGTHVAATSANVSKRNGGVFCDRNKK